MLFPYSEILACEQALHWGISPEVTRARDTRRDEEAQYGVLLRLASPDTQNGELASRLRNTCYRVEILLGVIFYLSLHFSPVEEGNEESLRGGCMRRLHFPYVFFFFFFFFSRALKINMNMED